MVVREDPRPPSHSHLVHRNLAHVPLGAVQVISIPNHDGHCNDAIDDCAPRVAVMASLTEMERELTVERLPAGL